MKTNEEHFGPHNGAGSWAQPTRPVVKRGGLTTKKKRPHFLSRFINFLKFKSHTS